MNLEELNVKYTLDVKPIKEKATVPETLILQLGYNNPVLHFKIKLDHAFRTRFHLL